MKNIKELSILELANYEYIALNGQIIDSQMLLPELERCAQQERERFKFGYIEQDGRVILSVEGVII